MIPMIHHVAILAYDGLCTFEFGCAVELFALKRPELGVAWYSHAVCAAEPGPLRAMGGLTVHAPHGLEGLATADTIVVPGWRDGAEAPPAPLLAALRAAHLRDLFRRLRAGACRPARRAQGHHPLAPPGTPGRAVPQVAVEAGALYVDDDRVITSAGSAAGLDMLLHVVRSDYGFDVANRVAQRLVVPADRDGDQQQLVLRPLPDADANRIAPLMDWVREHIRSSHTVASMAACARMGTRTFQRRFKDATGLPPLAWLVRERIALAARLLETRRALGIDAVADLAGLGSAESLRRHFRTHGMAAPGRYRKAGAPAHAA